MRHIANDSHLHMESAAVRGKELSRATLLGSGIVVAGWMAAMPARAQPAPPASGFMTNLWTRDTLLGDMDGLRPALGRYGISLGLTETSEVLGNVTGGVHRGFAYDGLTTLTIGLDTQKAFGWPGGTFNASVLQIHGRNLSADNLLVLQTASGIEAEDTTRLWELWYDQAFAGGRFDVKLGLQSLDQEFMASAGASLFLNAAMGWPVLPAADLYAGGPAYPLSSLGIRLRARPTSNLTLLAGVFDDNPPGGPFDDDSQLRGAERHGLGFNLNTGALFIAEAQYATDAIGGLPGTYKLGFWYDTAGFPDQRFGADGLSLAAPGSSDDPLIHRGNFSFYGMFDQTVWRPDPKGARALGVFARATGAPGDRNLVSFSLNAGITLKAPFPGRDNDTVGIGYGLAHVSGRTAALDRDTALFSGTAYPVRSNEQFIEVTYQYQVAPWWQLQPDFQYVLNPGGGIQNPDNPAQRVGNEAIIGLRTNIVF